MDGTDKAAKLAAGQSAEGTRGALVIFAKFKGENPERTEPPVWAADLFDASRPGSFTHFYDTMSFGQLHVSGEVAARRYEAEQTASAYLAGSPTEAGGFVQFGLEILRRVDADINFARYDNDGLDGVPNSGDDDGLVDALFIVLDSTPANFILGPATGVGSLGFEDAFATNDVGASGDFISISPSRGTLQQGRNFVETAASMCHEYGHVLGLPDLFNTDYLRTEGATPEEDSAGIGVWGLMGWGTLGWNRDDGPAAFCAWSRLRLGWVEVVGPLRERTDMLLEEVGRRGMVYQIPLNAREDFLVEYRRRDSTYYDGNIPGEGLLVWHVERTLAAEDSAPRWLVHLECADGKWLDAGYPEGSSPAPIAGGNNLDYWAHDPDYARAHNGNLGDATDPFDGVRFRAFSPETNPAAISNDGRQSMRMEDIRLEDGRASARLTLPRVVIDVEEIQVLDASGDGFLVAGEEAEVHFSLVNKGGLRATHVRAVLQGDAAAVEIVQAEARFKDLDLGSTTLGGTDGSGGFPRFRVGDDFDGVQTATLFVDIYANGGLVWTQAISVTAVSLRQSVRSFAVIDTLGNGDGEAQAGEFIRLALTLEAPPVAALRALEFSLRALDERAIPVGGAGVSLDTTAVSLARSAHSPEFLLSGALASGTELGFEFRVDWGSKTWRDTLELVVGEGGDRTPPRLPPLQAQSGRDGLSLILPGERVLDGSAVIAAEAFVYSLEDTALVAEVPMVLRDGRFIGVWRAAPPGPYLLGGAAEDNAGNRGFSPLRHITVFPTGEGGGVLFANAGNADRLELPGAALPARVAQVAFAPSEPHIAYLVSHSSLWRSEDGGNSWSRTGLMFDGSDFNRTRLWVDAEDPMTLYVENGEEWIRSHNGGRHWVSLNVPQGGFSFRLLGADPLRSAKLYGYNNRSVLFTSEDGGRIWRSLETLLAKSQSLLTTIASLSVHPAEPHALYILSTTGDVLWYSEDDGATWQTVELERKLRALEPDPRDGTALYGVVDSQVWHSADQGRSWRATGMGARGNSPSVRAHPIRPGALYVWNRGSADLRRSLDGGANWEVLDTALPLQEIYLDPRDEEGLFAIMRGDGGRLFHSRNRGEDFEPVELIEPDRPTGAMAIALDGQMFIASIGSDEKGRHQSGLLTSADGGAAWKWLPAPTELVDFTASFDALYVDPQNPRNLFGHLVHGIGLFLRSSDAGRSWTRLNLGIRGRSQLISYSVSITVDPTRDDVYYLSDGKGGWRSEDAGETWDQLYDAKVVQGGFVFDSAGGGQLYRTEEERVWHSRDGGATWEDLGPVAASQTITDLTSHPDDTGKMYAATNRGIYVSQDGARTWKVKLRPESGDWQHARIRATSQDPDRVLLVTARHLFDSRDGGDTWKEIGGKIDAYPWFQEGLVDPFDPSIVYASTTWGVYRLYSDVNTAVLGQEQTMPEEFDLAQNFPNPFNAKTVIAYQLDQNSKVGLTIYNSAGQVVRKLVQANQPPGRYRIVWDGTDDDEQAVGSGVYFYRLQAGEFQQTRRLVLVK